METGEKTLLVTRPTRLVALRYYVAMFFAFVFAAALYLRVINWFVPTFPNPEIAGFFLSTILAAVFAFLGFLALLAAELTRKTTRYIITDNKIIREDGILNKRTKMVPYTQLEGVDLHQTLFQRILRIGTIIVDTGDDSMNIDMVPRPKSVQELLSHRLGRRAWSEGPPPER